MIVHPRLTIALSNPNFTSNFTNFTAWFHFYLYTVVRVVQSRGNLVVLGNGNLMVLGNGNLVVLGNSQIIMAVWPLYWTCIMHQQGHRDQYAEWVERVVVSFRGNSFSVLYFSLRSRDQYAEWVEWVVVSLSLLEDIVFQCWDLEIQLRQVYQIFVRGS